RPRPGNSVSAHGETTGVYRPQIMGSIDARQTHASSWGSIDARQPGYRVGIDVGGTFTDLVLLAPDGTTVLEKTPTTPDDQSEGVVAGLQRLADALGAGSVEQLLTQTESIVHGTTAGDNTMIQMSGAPTGLLVTQGFRDEIELRRCYKEDIWDPAYPAPAPIARRRVRLEVPERITSEGDVDTPLDEDAVRRATRRLQAFGVRSIAIVFVHSYVNATHERRAREIVLEEYPDVELVSCSHDVYPKPPEFERTSTTLVNAYVGPPIVRYLDRLQSRLRDHGYDRELLVATSAGGVATPDAIAHRAVATIGSGPTGGVVAAARAARDADLGDVVSVDMGGTSYDVCLIRDGRPELKSDWNWRHRYCIALPMVDIQSIGAGGGSIARVVGGTLAVGPESAGSDPGPACYGRGGTEPTVTDADLVLGRLDPRGFWGGRLELDVDAATDALARCGKELGLDAQETAAAVVAIVDAHLADAIRRVLSAAGADPRRLDLVAFGGMGAVHATTQAAALGMRRVLVPDAAPGFSALGLLTADHVVDAARTHVRPWRDVDLAVLNALADDLLAKATGELRAAGVPEERMRFDWLLNLVYPGQTFDSAIPLARVDGHPLQMSDVEAAVESFHRRNEAARLIEARAQEPTVRGVRLVATGLVPQPSTVRRAEHDAPAAIGRRVVHTGDAWHDDVPVYANDTIGPGAVITGPALVVRPFTTIVLRAGDRARMLSDANMVIDVAPA
ncbi:MAG: N-methylhydantoinase, partial [Actinomycetota bacterium]|nr:N-methylhydantoinase [Actinomycetota bacterium]